jgi:hypothetical protein
MCYLQPIGFIYLPVHRDCKQEVNASVNIECHQSSCGYDAVIVGLSDRCISLTEHISALYAPSGRCLSEVTLDLCRYMGDLESAHSNERLVRLTPWSTA